MKICHTSDWHIGLALYGQKRYEEFEAFLEWMAETLQRERVDVLLIAGDVFDTTTPSNRAQELYYRFLARFACRHIVVIAGNHDSPSFLNAPQTLLSALNVHVVGAMTENLDDEVLLLNNRDGVPELIVCAVPFLRDRDVRTSEAAETMDDKDRKLLEGIRDHYLAVVELARQKRQDLGGKIPMVAMGHLFASS
ncbi:MAG: exonuclease subunit SbcD, partial [Magnetococcales bacterium]|nr:exonuclease subunit SbcD [Magnetococcales bacterium]